MAPSMTIGAVILLWRKAATNVIVFHSPNGACPINSIHRGPRPRSRTILVVTAVSSMNTSRAGSSMPCSRIQRRRACATSARCCSAARRLFFFKGDAVPPEKAINRALAGSNTPLAQFRHGFIQRQVRSFHHQGQDPLRMLLQRRNTPAMRLRRATPGLLPPLHPSHGRTYADFEPVRRFVPRCAAFHRLNHAFPQVAGIGLRHRNLPQGESMREESPIPNLLGIPPIHISREPL